MLAQAVCLTVLRHLAGTSSLGSPTTLGAASCSGDVVAGMLCRSGWLARRSYGLASRPRRVPAPDKFDDSVGRDFSGCQERHAKETLLAVAPENA